MASHWTKSGIYYMHPTSLSAKPLSEKMPTCWQLDFSKQTKILIACPELIFFCFVNIRKKYNLSDTGPNCYLLSWLFWYITEKNMKLALRGQWSEGHNVGRNLKRCYYHKEKLCNKRKIILITFHLPLIIGSRVHFAIQCLDKQWVHVTDSLELSREMEWKLIRNNVGCIMNNNANLWGMMPSYEQQTGSNPCLENATSANIPRTSVQDTQ